MKPKEEKYSFRAFTVAAATMDVESWDFELQDVRCRFYTIPGSDGI